MPRLASCLVVALLLLARATFIIFNIEPTLEDAAGNSIACAQASLEIFRLRLAGLVQLDALGDDGFDGRPAAHERVVGGVEQRGLEYLPGLVRVHGSNVNVNC